jgi:autotransporter-associated beta strand protein
MGNQRGDAAHPSTATFNIFGGALIATNITEDQNSGICFGWETYPPAILFNIHGGLVNVGTDMKMGRLGSVSHLTLHGGTLRARNITADSGEEHVLFNGGVFQPNGDGRSMAGLTEALVSTNGLVVDTSWAGPAGFYIDQTLLHDLALGADPDGGVVKRGAGLLTLRGADHTFTGTARVEGGTLLTSQTALLGKRVEVAPGAALGAHSRTSVDSLTLGEPSAAPAILDLGIGAGVVNTLTVTNALTVHIAEIRLHTSGSLDPVFPSGLHTVLVFNAASPAPSAAAFSGASAFPAKSAAFEIVDGDPGWKAVVMTVTDAYAPSTWITPGGGAWENAANWDTPPPNVAGAQTLFTAALPSDAAVTLAGATAVGKLTLDTGTAGGVTFSGGPLAFDNADPNAAIAALSGAHTFAAAVTFSGRPVIDTRAGASLTFAGAASAAGPLTTNPQNTGGGTVAFTGASVPSGPITNTSGTLRLNAFPAGGVTWGAGTLRYDGPETETAAPLKTMAAPGRAAILSLATNVTFTGPMTTASGGFIKRGPGTARFTWPGNIAFSAAGVGDSNPQVEFPANGDSPTAGFTQVSVAEGRLAWGAPGQTVSLGGLFIGSQIYEAGGQVTTGEVEIWGGTNRVSGYLIVGRNNGTPANSPAEPVRPRLILRDGSLTAGTGGASPGGGLVLAYDNQNQHSVHAQVDVHGGTLLVNHEFRVGNHQGNGAKATFNVYGGEVLHTNATQNIRLGWVTPAPDCDWNQYGGLTWTRGNMALGENGSHSVLRLHGGVIRANNITATATGDEHIVFNGGVFQPTGTGQSLVNAFTSAVVSTNGACFDTSLASGGLYTLLQPLVRDAALGDAPDGGLVKAGSNTLVLSAANTFAGPVTVTGGVLRATVDGAVPDELRVCGEGVFDAADATRTVARVSGDGLCSNGTVRVTAAVTPDAGRTLTFANLTLAAGATLRCGAGSLIAVDGQVSAEGAGTVDFGRTEADPLPYPFSAVVLTYGTGADFAGWRAAGTGYPPGAYAVRFVRDESVAPHVVRAETVPAGTLFSVR